MGRGQENIFPLKSISINCAVVVKKKSGRLPHKVLFATLLHINN